MHYARHVCEELMLKYNISRGTCVKKTFEAFSKKDDFNRYFDVREVK